MSSWCRGLRLVKVIANQKYDFSLLAVKSSHGEQLRCRHLHFRYFQLGKVTAAPGLHVQSVASWSWITISCGHWTIWSITNTNCDDQSCFHQLLFPYRNCTRQWLDFYLVYMAWKDHTWSGRRRKKRKGKEYWQMYQAFTVLVEWAEKRIVYITIIIVVQEE